MQKTALFFRKFLSAMVIFMTLTTSTTAYAGELVTTPTVFQPEAIEVTPAEYDGVLTNPLMGWVVEARYVKDKYLKQPVTMAYVGLTWKKLQPESEDIYNWDVLENGYNLQYCRDNNIKVILRILLDKPEKFAHKDIPDWLYEKIDGENGGFSYNLKSGEYQGFSPDYTNSVLIAEHEKLLKAIGQRYANDPVIGFIQLGSIGHYGEWCIKPEVAKETPYPSNDIIRTYLNHYKSAFPGIHMLTRRPFEAIGNDTMGFYNDSFGKEKEDCTWLSWINGSISRSSTYSYKASPDFWKYAPSGGEFANGDPAPYLSEESIDQSLKMVEDSHTSWLGPGSPVWLNGKSQPYIDSMMKKMGYRYAISSVKLFDAVTAGQTLRFSVDWINKGVAPFYYRWPVEFSIGDEKGNIVSSYASDADIRNWLPGGTHTADGSFVIPKGLSKGSYKLLASILDPATGRPSIKLAITGKRADGRYELASFKVE